MTKVMNGSAAVTRVWPVTGLKSNYTANKQVRALSLQSFTFPDHLGLPSQYFTITVGTNYILYTPEAAFEYGYQRLVYNGKENKTIPTGSVFFEKGDWLYMDEAQLEPKVVINKNHPIVKTSFKFL